MIKEIKGTDHYVNVGNKGRRCKFALYECSCGNTVKLRKDNVKSGGSHSCGCKNKFEKHDMCRTKIYKVWMNMKNRCLNKNNPRYADYGKRGITVSPEWKDSFLQFYKDMGDIPIGKTIDRIDNNGNYCKENCKWSNISEQSINKRNNLVLIYKGESLTLKELCKKYHKPYDLVKHRLYLGWLINEAIERPKNGTIK